MSVHSIRESTGFGNNESLFGKRRCLQHYLNRPNTYHNNQRAQQRIKQLTQEIEQLEQEQNQ